jgi:hypothetical protein
MRNLLEHRDSSSRERLFQKRSQNGLQASGFGLQASGFRLQASAGFRRLQASAYSKRESVCNPAADKFQWALRSRAYAGFGRAVFREFGFLVVPAEPTVLEPEG